MANPGLGALADNGGPTLTMALLPGSPAIEAGDITQIPIDPSTGLPLTTDQRGLARTVNGNVDIGAFELQVTSISVSAASAALVYGQTATFTATLTAPLGDPTPTSSDGTVTFYDGTTVLGSATLSGSPATATLSTSALALGSHTITASYSGDATFAASRSGVESTRRNRSSRPPGSARPRA